MKTKVLNYGAYPRHNDIVVHYLELTPLIGDGIFTALSERDRHGDDSQDILYVILKIKEVCFVVDSYRRYHLAKEELRTKLSEYCQNWVETIQNKASEDKYIRNMEIRIFSELGLDTAPLIRSREVFLKNKSEQERTKAEEQERVAKERKRQDEKAENERLDKVKADFLQNELISSEDFLAIAKRDGYEIHIRTQGTIRQRLIRF